MEKIKNLKKLRSDVKAAQAQVKNVHNCPFCSNLLDQIKDHQNRGHQD